MADAGQSPVTPIDGEIVAVSPKSPVLMESVQRSDAASALDMSAPVNGGSGNKKNVTAASQQARIGNVSKFHQFRTPQQCVQLKKKTWNKRQKCHHHMKYLHHTHQLQQQQLHHQQQQQSAACKADLENIQSNKNPIGHHRIPAGMCAACGVEAGNNNSLQCKNSKQQIYKKLLSHRPCTGGVGGCSACNGVVNNVNGGAPPLAHHPLFCSRSKFFLPDKRPRKEIIVPPTKFLLGGNISDPLNLNSLQNEANSSNSNTPATTPRQSPITTPPKVEVIIPPNIHDPLHLLDPVDTVEYEKQLTSPLKRKSKSSKSKHRHRKKKTKRRRCDSTNLIIDEQADPQVSSCGSASTELFKDCAAPSDCCSSFSDGNLSAEYRAEVETNAGVYHENKDDDATNDTSSCRQVVNNVAQHLGDAEQAGEPNNHEFTTRVQAQVNSASKHEVGENKKSTNGISNSDRENVKKDLRLDLSGISTINQHAHYGTVGSGPGSVSSCSGRKRKVSEGTCSAKNKFRRMDSMDKIVSPVVPQPGAWKRPPRVAPTGSRKLSRHRTSSHGDLDLLSPVDDSKTVTDTDSVRADTPDLDTNYKFTDAFSASSPLSVVSVNTSDNNVTTEKNSGSISAIENFDSSSKATKVPNFRADGAKYQYGNYDRYPTYRNFNELMDDVRLQVFLRNQELFQGKDILDIGCNVGHITIAVARNLGPKSVLGIDIDKNLIARARKNLSMYVTIPQAKTEQKNTHAKAKGVDSKDDKQQSNRRQKKKTLNHNQHVHIHHYHSHHMHPIQNQYSQKLFPVSFPLTYGPIPGTQGHLQSDPEPSSSANSVEFPKNVFFRQTNYVLKDETLLSNDAQQYDLILCLSVTKWIHLNFGDNGLKMAFKRIFNQLRPGGKLILEAQNWASYKKRKNLTETIYNNYKNIEFFPNKFHEYLLSNEVGFSHSYTLGVPRHMSKGFCRPIQLYAKGDFTPNHVRWSDAYYPQTPYEPYRGIYATMPRAPHPIPNAYETPGSYSVRQTPMHQPTSQYYNPLETDSYLPSYDIEFLNQLYVFASPLYQTVWSPPASMRNSSSHTPLFGSLRDLENEEGSGGNSIHRHVYPPNDETSSPNANGAFNSIREPDTDDSQAPSHVYANCDSSSSPHVNGYDTQEGLEEQPAAHRSSQGQNGCTDSNES